MLQCLSLCMLLGLSPVPELLCLPIAEIPHHSSTYLGLQNTVENSALHHVFTSLPIIK